MNKLYIVAPSEETARSLIALSKDITKDLQIARSDAAYSNFEAKNAPKCKVYEVILFLVEV